ncbi:MAG: DUF1922 domain-containing protein [Candidatus Bathyarchaeota archaeon]|nr:MAG: DUF1922 domain-containing protein [Candidatus Bathyarchaeota archaeon]
MYVVIVCSRCGHYLLAKGGSKTRQCPYCQIRLRLAKVKKVASAKSPKEASALIRALKQRRSEVLSDHGISDTDF